MPSLEREYWTLVSALPRRASFLFLPCGTFALPFSKDEFGVKFTMNLGVIYTMTPCVGQSAPSILLSRVIDFLVVTGHTFHPSQLRRCSVQACAMIGKHNCLSCWHAHEKIRGLGLWQKSEHLGLEQGLSAKEADLRNPETETPPQWNYLSLDQALLLDPSVLWANTFFPPFFFYWFELGILSPAEARIITNTVMGGWTWGEVTGNPYGKTELQRQALKFRWAHVLLSWNHKTLCFYDWYGMYHILPWIAITVLVWWVQISQP